VITLEHAKVKLQAGPKLTGKSALQAAGAKITSGTLTAPNLTSILTKPGTHKVKVTGKSAGIAANPVTLTIVVRAARGRRSRGSR
jgi:hypothetical protein